MTKTLLLAATALTVVGISSVASAQAVGYSLALSNTDGTTNNAIEAALVLADELTIPVAGLDTAVEFALIPTTTAVLPLGNSLLTIDLGADSFGTNVTAGAVLQDSTVGNCNPTRSVAFGGGANDSTVTFLLSNLSDCDNGSPLRFRIPLEIDDESAVSISTNFRTEGAQTPIDGGTNTINNVVSFASAFDIAVVADGVLGAVADVNASPVYSNLQPTVAGGFTQNLDLGDVVFDINSGVFVDFWQVGDAPAAPLAAALGDINTGINITINATTGSFAGLSASIDGADANVELGADDNAATTADNFKSGDVLVAQASIANPDAFAILVADSTGAIEGGTFSATAVLDLDAQFTDETATGAIDPVTLGGTNFVAPWLAINNANNSSTVRVSNLGAATGPVILTLFAPNVAQASGESNTCTTAQLPKLASVPANGRIELTVNDLRTCFGTTVANGDVRVTIQGAPDQLTAQARLRSSTGTVVETSLGRLGETGLSY